MLIGAKFRILYVYTHVCVCVCCPIVIKINNLSFHIWKLEKEKGKLNQESTRREIINLDEKSMQLKTENH